MCLLAQAECTECISGVWSCMIQECVEKPLDILCDAQLAQSWRAHAQVVMHTR